jgi:hypothetical protein
MVAPAEAFHRYVTEVPPALLPLAGEVKIGADGIVLVAADADAEKRTALATMENTRASVINLFLENLMILSFRLHKASTT